MGRFIGSCLVIAWCGVVAGLHGEDEPRQTAKSPIAHRVVRISQAKDSQPCEVSVAIDPTNPKHIIASSIGRASGGRFGGSLYVTFDGGASWTTVSAPTVPDRIHGDDLVAFGPDGIAYTAHIAFQGIRERRPRRASAGIFVSSSKDGLSWTSPTPVIDHLNSCEPMEDKPWMCVDCSPASKYKGNLYIAWTRFDVYGSKEPGHKSHIFFSRSTDKGRTFSVPFRLSDTPGDCLDSDNTVEGAVPATGPNGEIYVAWAGPKGLLFKKSTDGGLNFGPEQHVSDMPGGWDFPIDGLARCNGMPVTGVDTSKGSFSGSVYVNWIDDRNKDPDVFVAHSRDGGASWSKPVRVNNDPVGNRKEQFFTWMAVDPVDGSINVLFFDRRSTTGTKTAVCLARSVDGGQTFVNYEIDQEPFAMDGGVFFGDYNGISAYGGLVIGVYPYFHAPGQLAVGAAIFSFKPGAQSAIGTN